MPWGFIGAAVLVVAVELALRGIGRMKLIAFATDEGQYHAARDTIDAQGPAEVSLIGSSQMREGVSMPFLLSELKQLTGRQAWAANYAMRGARVDVLDAAVRYLKRQPHPPKLIVVGISARDIRAEEPDWPRVAIFWSPADWWAEFKQRRATALGVLPVVVRSEVGRAIWSLRYREEISLWTRRHFARFGVDADEENNPILGETTTQHLGKRGVSTFLAGLVPLHRMFDAAKDSYLLDHSPRPPKVMLQRLQMLANNFRAEPASLWVEMPVAIPLREVLDRVGQIEAFNTAVIQTVHGKAIDFQPVAAEPALANKLFRDLQHLNRNGAKLFSRWLAGEIVKHLKTTDSSAGAGEK